VITLATNYEQQPDGSYRQGRAYTRADNPTSEHAEQLLAALEGGGCGCALFGSGMAAATAVFQALPPGDHVLVSCVLYFGVRKWLAEFALAWGLDVEFTDTTDLATLAAAIRPGQTRLLWVETPANPTWEITDLAAACKLAHAAGVRVAAGTVATPVHTRPFEHGADLVVHSASKYLNAHMALALTPGRAASRTAPPAHLCPSVTQPRWGREPHGRQDRVTVRSPVESLPMRSAQPSRIAVITSLARSPDGVTAARSVAATAAGYFTATSSAMRMFGSPARRSGSTWPRAWGIGPARCASRASSVSKVSKMP
jgi:Cys/Met metabolism PLP-dependent enzyme